MDFIIDAITEWIKDFLIEAITGNLSNMFGDVNTKVATIAGEVGKTPEQWNSGVFSMIHSLSESVIVPIAGLVIAAVLSYELIRMVIDRNNMHDFDTFIFFKWIIKAGIAAYVVSHTFDFIIAIFEVAQTMVQQSAGVIDANASIDISSALASITTELEAKGLGELFALMLETWVVSFAMTVMGALITIIGTYRCLSFLACLTNKTPEFRSMSLVSNSSASFLRKPHPYSIRSKMQNRTALSGLLSLYGRSSAEDIILFHSSSLKIYGV